VKLAERVEPILTLDVEPLCRSSIRWSRYCGIPKGQSVHRVKGRLQVDMQWLTEFAVNLRLKS